MPVLEREEYIEQAYFFHSFRERLLDGIPAQDVLTAIGEEILSTTRLPLAVSYMHSEAKLSGLVGPAMARLAHYFAPFQTYVINIAEQEQGRLHAEAQPLALGLAHDECLEGGEVVAQAGEAGREQAGVFQLGGEEADGQGQARGGEDFLADAREHVLGGDVVRQPLAPGPEEVGLLDVLLAVQDGAHRGHATPGTRGLQRAGVSSCAAPAARTSPPLP